MFRKHSVLAGITGSLLLLVLAAAWYPGGSPENVQSAGFNWRYNYLCNLFGSTAVNGLENKGRFLAIPAMLLLCFSLALFFLRFSRKLADANLRKLVAFSGTAAMGFAFLVVTPFHDVMTTAACTLTLLALFSILVALYKGRHYGLVVMGAVCMLVLYFASYVYYSGQWLSLLPVLQKISFGLTAGWFLLLDYRVADPSSNAATGG